MNRLKLNQVGHQIIYLNEDRFIASGMIFEWRGQQYRICLLTYDKALLEDNILLECKNSIIIILLLVLALLIILSMMMSKKIRGQASRIALQEERAIWQNQQLEQLDEQMKREHAFSARKRVFKHTVLDEFLQELDERGPNRFILQYLRQKPRSPGTNFLNICRWFWITGCCVFPWMTGLYC